MSSRSGMERANFATAGGPGMKTVEITYRYGARGTALRPRPADANSAARRLEEGNRAFADLLTGLTSDNGTSQRVVDVDPRDLGVLTDDGGAPKQQPFAVVMGCSDARVPIELIFNQGPNDLFVIRIAGNGLGDEVLGSLRYAAEHLRGSLRLVVVLGHSECGALTAAVDAYLDPGGYLRLATNYSLRSIVDRQLIVVQAAARRLASAFGRDIISHSRYREALIETAIVTNAALTAYTVEQELGSIKANAMQAVYGVYLLRTHEVWAPHPDLARRGLAAPPKNLPAFVELADLIVHSERIAPLLTSP
jgi:carbonic anhydrase